jgi:hypothetical protein
MTVAFESRAVSARRGVRWIREVRVDDVVTFRVGRAGTRMIAEWPGTAKLTCAADGSRARLTSHAGVSSDVLPKLRRGPVQALLRDLRGELSAHAAAVAVAKGAVLFVGPSGAGKSTAAAEMCLLHEAMLLADDVALLEVRDDRVSILPSEREHQLTPASRRSLRIPARGAARSEKVAITPEVAASRPARLALIVVLRFDEDVDAADLRPLRGRDVAHWLLQSIVRFDVEDAGARRRELEQITKMYRHIPVVEIVRPLRGRSARRIGALVLRALEEVG